jgi:ABC transporter substrate binding protein
MDRRKFTTVLASATVAWPLALRAQQSGRMRRIGVLMNLAEHDPESKPRVAEIESGLAELGRARDRLRVEYRWAADNSRLIRTYAAELARDNVDAIVANGLPAAQALKAETRTIPVVCTRRRSSRARPGEKYITPRREYDRVHALGSDDDSEVASNFERVGTAAEAGGNYVQPRCRNLSI